MAKTPTQKGRRPSPRKKPRASRPTRKGGSPYQSGQAFAQRAGRTSDELLLHPLTEDQKADIRACFGTQHHQDAEQLLRDWDHVSMVAYQTALADYKQAERRRILFGGRAGQQRRARLKKAHNAAGKAIAAVEAMVKDWRYELDTAPGVDLGLWTDSAILKLAQEREAILDYYKQAVAWPKASVKRGPPEEPATYRLKVLAAYFRHHGWEVSSKKHSLFANIAMAVATGNPLNHTRLKAVVASRYSYTLPST